MEGKGDALHMRNNAANGLFCGEGKPTRFARNKRLAVREAGKASPFAGEY
jgi:hypothetical protein